MGFVTRECPRCDGDGEIQTFESASFEDFGAHIPAVLEVPCPTCGARMDHVENSWYCPICHSKRALDADHHIERLTDDAYPAGSGKPGVLMGDCPVCGHPSGVNGGPDGELECDECGEFWAYQFSSEWFAYSIWQSRAAGPVVVNGRWDGDER